MKREDADDAPPSKKSKLLSELRRLQHRIKVLQRVETSLLTRVCFLQDLHIRQWESQTVFRGGLLPPLPAAESESWLRLLAPEPSNASPAAPVGGGPSPPLLLPSEGMTTCNKKLYSTLFACGEGETNIRDGPSPSPTHPAMQGDAVRSQPPVPVPSNLTADAVVPLEVSDTGVRPHSRTPSSETLSSQDIENCFRECGGPVSRKSARRREEEARRMKLLELRQRTWHEVKEDGECVSRGATVEDLLSVIQPVSTAKRAKTPADTAKPPQSRKRRRSPAGAVVPLGEGADSIPAPPKIGVPPPGDLPPSVAERSFLRSRKRRLELYAEEVKAGAGAISRVGDREKETPPLFWSTAFPTPPHPVSASDSNSERER